LFSQVTTQHISEQSVVTALPDNLSSALGSEAVILNMSSGRYFGLNTTGAFIWEVVQQPVALSEIERRMCEEFEVSPEQCRQDLRQVLQEMLEHGMIEVR
jgi:Coenzyme PQQ synthesis protein D (PqqD)